MSYILDALRRAEADRQRGQVPKLGVAQPAAAAEDNRQQRRLKLALAGLLVLLAIGAAGLAGWWRGAAAPTQPPRPATPVIAEQASPPSLPAPVPVPPRAQMPLPQVVSAPPAAKPGTLPAALPPTLPGLTSTPATSAAPLAAPPPQAAEATARASAPGVERAPVTRPVKLGELPAEQRRELPALAVNGSVWSDSAASRFVILNGQVLREGDSVAPGLVLEKLLPKAAHLRWRGLLLEVPL